MLAIYLMNPILANKEISMKTSLIEYSLDGFTYEGYLAFDESSTTPLPTILIAHTWVGRNSFVCQKAEMLADNGYAAFAIDLFGKGVLGRNKEENMALIKPYLADRMLLRKRMLETLKIIQGLEQVDQTRIAAIGFCFGGLCVLDLARAGADIRGVISFHGLLDPPGNLVNETIRARVLALHGHDDPMATPKQAQAFQQEMTKTKADWQMTIYGNTMHAFTNTQANDSAAGTVYNPLADQRSQQAMLNFLQEIF